MRTTNRPPIPSLKKAKWGLETTLEESGSLGLSDSGKDLDAIRAKISRGFYNTTEDVSLDISDKLAQAFFDLQR